MPVCPADMGTRSGPLTLLNAWPIRGFDAAQCRPQPQAHVPGRQPVRREQTRTAFGALGSRDRRASGAIADLGEPKRLAGRPVAPDGVDQESFLTGAHYLLVRDVGLGY